MFTGIVQASGKFIKMDKKEEITHLWIEHTFGEDVDLSITQSMAVDGACLTLAEITDKQFRVDVLDETIQKTHLKSLGVGWRFNLEKAAKVGDEIGGHVMTGHVDGTGEVVSIEKVGADVILRISIKDEWRSWLISKCCIAVNGVSLTVVDATKTDFSVHLIPITLEETNLSLLNKGSLVNLEFDVMAKYLYNFYQVHKEK